jgi:hypothetical protein
MGTNAVPAAAHRLKSVVTQPGPPDLDVRDAGIRQSYQQRASAARVAVRVRWMQRLFVPITQMHIFDFSL